MRRQLVEPRGSWMQTATGIAFPVAAPKAEDIDLIDLATALAWINRFTGHVGTYSVATHCVLISQWLEGRGYDAEVCLAGLLHDAHEAYLGDLSRPLQDALEALCPGFKAALRALKAKTDAAILEALGLTGRVGLYDSIIHEADVRILIDERDELWTIEPPFPWLGGAPVQPLGVPVVRQDPEVAMAAWLDRFEVLTHTLNTPAR